MMKSPILLIEAKLAWLARYLPFGKRWLRRKAREYERQALRAYFERDTANAIELFEHALEWDPTDSSIHSQLGQIFYERGEYKQAIQEFKTTLALDYFDQRAIRGLAFSSHSVGDLNEAVYWYLRCVQENPEDLDILLNLGAVLYDLGKYEEATEYYKQAVAINPDDATAYANLGRSYFSLGRYDDALNTLRQATQLDAEDSDVHHLMGLALEAKGEVEQALQSLKLAIKYDGTNTDALLDAARLLSSMGDLDGAIGYTTTAVKTAEETQEKSLQSEANWELGWLYYLTGNWEESAKASEAALAIDPSLLPVRFNLGLTLLRQGKQAEAREEYEKGIQGVTSAADLKRNAISDLQDAIEKCPDLPGGKELLTRLEIACESLQTATRPPGEQLLTS